MPSGALTLSRNDNMNQVGWIDFPAERVSISLNLPPDSLSFWADRFDLPFSEVKENLNNWADRAAIGFGLAKTESLAMSDAMAGARHNLGWRENAIVQFLVPANFQVDVHGEQLVFVDPPIGYAFALVLDLPGQDMNNWNQLVQSFPDTIFPRDSFTLTDRPLEIAAALFKTIPPEDANNLADAPPVKVIGIQKNIPGEAGVMADAMTGERHSFAWQDLFSLLPNPVNGLTEDLKLDVISWSDFPALGLGISVRDSFTLADLMLGARHVPHWKDVAMASATLPPLGLNAPPDSLNIFLADKVVIGLGLDIRQNVNNWADPGQVVIFADALTHWKDFISSSDPLNPIALDLKLDTISWSDRNDMELFITRIALQPDDLNGVGWTQLFAKTLNDVLTLSRTDDMNAVGWNQLFAKTLGTGFIGQPISDDANNLSDSLRLIYEIARTPVDNSTALTDVFAALLEDIHLSLMIDDTNVNSWQDVMASVRSGNVHIKVRSKIKITSITINAVRFKFMF